MKRFLDMLGAQYREQERLPKIGVADFYCPAENVAIEVDGVWWHSQPGNRANDIRKDAAYAARGITVVRVPDTELVA